MKQLLVLLCALAAVLAQNPGFKTCLTEAAFQYGANVGVEILQEQLNSIQIPPITQQASTPIGGVTFYLTNIVLGSLNIPNAGLSLDASTGITASVSDVTASATLNWQYKEDSWPHISDSGSADITVSQTSITAVLAVGMANARPTVQAKSVQVSVGHLDINLHGGASWLYNLFISLFQGTIQSAVQSAMQSSIQQAINQNAQQALSTLPVEENINSNIDVNFGLTTSPVFTSSYMVTQHSGEFDSVPHPSPYPAGAASMPDIITSDEIQMFFSAWSLNSLMTAFMESNMLSTYVTPNMVPPNFPYTLNTNCSIWQYICPNMSTTYPNTPMQLFFECTTPPVVSFSSTGALIAAKGLVYVQVITASGVEDAFILETIAFASGEATVANSNLTATLAFLNATVEPVNSTVGNVSGTMLNDIMAFVFKGLVPLINHEIGNGFPLPSIQGVNLIQPQVVWDEGYLAITTNCTYTPPGMPTQPKQRNHVPVKIRHSH